MKKSIRLLLFIAFSICSLFAIGQEKKLVTGSVTDSLGKPVPSANIKEKGTKNQVISGEDGTFKISVAPNATLIITSVGFLSQDVKVGSGNTVAVSLTSSSNELTGVVVTAYGISKKDKNLGYSVTKVSGSSIERTNTINPITALQGKVAGVQVNVVTSAGVQTSPYIQIRGASVLGGNNQPIFVVDGNILQNNLVNGDAADGGSQLKNLNPDDYESITVLKGAAATALYGSRGLNGAIVITTKTGRAGKGIGVEYSTTYQSDHVYKPFMALQNEYGMGSYYREGHFAPDGTMELTTSDWGPKFDGTLHPSVYNTDTLVPYVAQPDNWKAFFKNGQYANNNLTLSGGSDKANFRISYSNTYNAGILPKNGLNRNAVDMKFGGIVNKMFSVEMGINYANTSTFNYYNQSRYAYGGGSNLGFDVYYLPRNTNFADWYAHYRNTDNSTIPDNFNGWVTNAFSSIDKNNYTNHENSLLGYAQIKAQVNDWIDLTGRLSINYYKQFAETKNFGNEQNNLGGQYAISSSNATTYDAVFTAHAVKTAMNKDLSIDFRVLNEYYGNRLGENLSASTNGGLKVPNQFFLGNSVNTIANNFSYGQNINGSFFPGPALPSQLTVGLAGDLNLNYKGYLNLEITGRNDWLSTLTYPSSIQGANNYSVFYPSANLSWSFTDTWKDKMPDWLSYGKLRASLAYVGNGGILSPYSTSSGYSPGTIINQAGQSITIATQFNGNVSPNLNLKPQNQRSIELGTNLSFVNDLINVDFTYYKNNTFNQTISIPGVIETGYTKLLLNAGNIQNTGLEFLVDINPIRTKDWNLDFSFNGSHNRSKIVSLFPGISKWQITGGYEGAEVWGFEGGDFGDLIATGGYGHSAFQLDPKTGYPIIEFTDQQVSTQPGREYNFANYQYDYLPGDSLVNMGRIEPDFVFGFSTAIRYKNFSLFGQIDGRLGGMTYSESYTYAMGNGSPLNSLQFRDKEHGGVARTDGYTGETVYNGAVPNAVFAQGQVSPVDGSTNIGGMTFREAYDKKLVDAWYAPAYYDGGFGYAGTYDWENGLNYNGAIAKNSWIMLREITLGYSIPPEILSKIKFIQSVNVRLSARNIGYLYKTLPGDQNPASIQSNDPFNPWITGGVPYVRSYSVSLNVKF